MPWTWGKWVAVLACSRLEQLHPVWQMGEGDPCLRPMVGFAWLWRFCCGGMSVQRVLAAAAEALASGFGCSSGK